MSVVFALSTVVAPSMAKDRGFFGDMKRLLFPPDDLFELVAKTKIDIAKVNEKKWSNFQIKYDGPYSYGILLENFSTDDYGSFYKKAKEIELRVKLEFFENNRPIFTTKSNVTEFYHFLGLRGNGLRLGSFGTPEDIPLKKEIECKITVIASDESLQNKYGPVWFYVKKESEK